MEKVHVNFMNDLRNHEFVELYNIIINYIEKQEVDDVNVKIAFEGVKSHRIKLSNMGKRKHSKFSIKNKKLTHLRNEYLNSLRYGIKSCLLSHIPAMRVAAKQVHFATKLYGREYYVATILPQTRLVDDLENRLKNDKSFKEAVLFLKLDDLLNTIFDITVDIMANYNKRVMKNAETKTKREGVKQAAYHDMKIMADAINFTASVNQHNEEKKVIVEELIDNIDGILKDFLTPMKSRNTKRKNQKVVGAAVQNLINPQEVQQNLVPEGEDVDDEDEPAGDN